VDDPATSWAELLADADDQAWLIGAFVHLVNAGGLDSTTVRVVPEEDRIAAAVLVAAGVLSPAADGFSVPPAMAVEAGSGLATRAHRSVSSMRQLAGRDGNRG
jgi:hypothetical protein